MLDGAMLLALYLALYRATRVPRILSGAGLIAAALMIIGVGRTLFGYDVLFPLLAPAGLAQLSLSIWLIVKPLEP
jgi:hypothetical protein